MFDSKVELERLEYIKKELGTSDFPYPFTQNRFNNEISRYINLVDNTEDMNEKLIIVNKIIELNIILVKIMIYKKLKKAIGATISNELYFNYVKVVYYKCEHFIVSGNNISRNLELYYLIIDNRTFFGNNNFIGLFDLRNFKNKKRKDHDDIDEICTKISKI